MRRVQIRKVARLGTGHTPSRSVDAYWDPAEGAIPWLTLADVWQLRDGTVSVVNETKEKISPLGLANSAAVRHPAGTVAFSRTASVGFSCVLGTEMATSQDFVTWTCGPRLEPRYLLWVLRGERDDILRRTQGSTHKTIYMPDIEQLTIPLPPVDEQQRIIRFLDRETARVDGVVERRVRMIKLLDDRVASVRAAWWQGWADHCGVVPLRRLGAQVEQGWSPRCDVVEAEPTEWGVLKTSSVSGNVFVPMKNKRLPDDVPVDRRWQVRDGDLLVVRGSGSLRAVGAAAVAQPGDRLLTISDLLYRVRGLSGSPHFFANALQAPQVRQIIERTIRTDVGQALKLRSSDVLDLPVPAVGTDRRTEAHGQLEDLMRPMTALRRRLIEQLELIRAHRISMIAGAVAGGIPVAA